MTLSQTSQNVSEFRIIYTTSNKLKINTIEQLQCLQRIIKYFFITRK